MITINEPLTIATQQRYDIYNINQTKDDVTQEWRAEVNYNVLNQEGVSIKNGRMEYRGEEFNRFSLEYTSDRFLYNELINHLNLEATAEEVEENFQNTI